MIEEQETQIDYDAVIMILRSTIQPENRHRSFVDVRIAARELCSHPATTLLGDALSELTWTHRGSISTTHDEIERMIVIVQYAKSMNEQRVALREG